MAIEFIRERAAVLAASASRRKLVIVAVLALPRDRLLDVHRQTPVSRCLWSGRQRAARPGWSEHPDQRAGDGDRHGARLVDRCAVAVAFVDHPIARRRAGTCRSFAMRRAGADLLHHLRVPVRTAHGVLDLPFPDWVKVVLGLALPASANVAEIFRGAIQSIPSAQWEAAQSLAFRRGEIFRSDRAAAVLAAHVAAVDEPVRQHHHEHRAGLAGGRARLVDTAQIASNTVATAPTSRC
jgi:ABC-type amino acid transport system permease subunit